MYRINYSDGSPSIQVDTLTEAAATLGDVVYCRNGDTVSAPAERELDDAGRILVWASECDANGPDGGGDAGQDAFAEIVRA